MSCVRNVNISILSDKDTINEINTLKKKYIGMCLLSFWQI